MVNDPEFIAYAIEKWCEKHGIDLVFIQKGKPHQNGYIERFNPTLRDEVLDVFAFDKFSRPAYSHAHGCGFITTSGHPAP